MIFKKLKVSVIVSSTTYLFKYLLFVFDIIFGSSLINFKVEIEKNFYL